MSRLLLLTGVQGSGKSKVTDQLARQPGLQVADLGTLLFDLLASRHSLKSRDQLRDLPAATMVAALPLALTTAVTTCAAPAMLLVTHLLPRRLGDCYFPQQYGALGPALSGIIMLVADPADLMRRRQQDHTRVRAPADTALLAAEQRRYWLVALVMAAELGLPCWAVHNQPGAHLHAVAVIERLLKHL